MPHRLQGTCNLKQHHLVDKYSKAPYVRVQMYNRFADVIALFSDLIIHYIGYVFPGTETIEYKGNSWHDECFTCYSCKCPIGTQSFLSKGSDVYCSPCYDKKFAKRCVSCNKVGFRF